MATFVLLSRQPRNDTIISEKIAELFPADDYYKIGRGQWLIAFRGTAKGLYNKIVRHEDSDLKVAAGVVVLRISGYWGLAPSDMWEWIVAKGESPAGA
jgi:hypothetical protein